MPIGSPSPTPSTLSAAPPKRILIIRPSALGDVCRTVPVLVSLRKAFPWPGTSIDWLVQDTFAAAISSHPDLTGVVAFPRKALSAWHNPATLLAIRKYLASIRRARYDLVLDCQALFRSGAFAAATGAPRRIGYSNAPELGWLGLTEHVHNITSPHTVDRMLALAEAATGQPAVRDMRLYTAPADREYVTSPAHLNLAPNSYILLAPTSRWSGKLWPPERFAELSRRLLADNSLNVNRIVFIGAASESAQCAPLAALAQTEPRITNLLGRTTVGQLMAVIEHARLVIASDSAALHMAVGFNRPLIALFGPTRVERVGPYHRERDVIQHITPADHLDHKNATTGAALMQRITIDEVLARAIDLLQPLLAAHEVSGGVTPRHP